jgi:hypothetical protein
MSGIVLVGILSGMIFGAFATIVRPYASTIILTPVILAPLVFLFMWRDALIGHCFFASNFGTEACTPMRALVSTTLAHAGDTVIVVVSHIVIAYFMVALLTVLRDLIARANMKSPYQREMERKAFERKVEAQLQLKKKMEEDMEAATKAIHASRAARKTGRSRASAKSGS